MQFKSLLMSGAVAGLAFAGTAFAKNAPVTSAPTPAATASAVDAMQTQINAMQAQVAYMKRQLELMTEKNPPSAKTPKVTISNSNKFALESSDGQYSIGLTGRLHADVGDYVDFSPKSKSAGPQALNSGFNVRRARIGVTGKAAGDFTYQLVYDFGGSSDALAAGNSDLQAAQVGYTGIKNVIIEGGYSDTFFTLDEATSSNDILFMERATPGVVATGINAGDFRSNFGARYTGDRLWIGAYVLGPASGNTHSPNSQSIGAFQRIAYQVLAEPDYSLHLGVGVDEIIKAPNSGPLTANSVTLSDRPELRVDSTSLLTTGGLGSIAANGQSRSVSGGYILDLEAAGGYGPFFAQGEYLHFNIDRYNLATAEFDGGYGEVAYSITGETRKYNKGSGAYGGLTPAHAFSPKDGYWGAWEVGARYSYIDLTSNFTPGVATSLQPSAVNGGKQEVFTAGLNWYPNSYMRFMLNYVHTEYNKANPTTTSYQGVVTPIGGPIGASIDAIGLRTQVAW
ncbi:MAG: Phosphatespecific outer rane porin OprP Pyrophosphatespecific outer rane porin OprO [Rhodospirillales bacterium]|nr:Phosphatespecific outer rane porin OprP Pyrophosphatespecific outer rane porin OprO [Rhodospirillales bacterium]